MKKTIYLICIYLLVLNAASANSLGRSPLSVEFFESGTNNELMEIKDQQDVCNTKASGADFAAEAIVVDIAVSLAVKATESLIDAVSKKMDKTVTALESTIPIEGFYKGSVAKVNNEETLITNIAVDGGCLVFHNGGNDINKASFSGKFRLESSADKSAVKFVVKEWNFKDFIVPKTNWSQEENRDFVIEINFSSPGGQTAGATQAYAQIKFENVSKDQLATVLKNGMSLPWIATPPISTKAAIRHTPLNLQVKIIETTKPNQLATWIKAIADDKKTDISGAVADELKKQLDPSYASTQQLTALTKATEFYTAYKTAWDAYALEIGKYESTNESAKIAWKAKVIGLWGFVEATKGPAKSAYKLAGLSWPGDLAKILLPQDVALLTRTKLSVK